jgi:2-C-methyl-D-erythritol 4-phosphate cytidylyltransferase
MARAERIGVIVPAAGDGRRLGASQCKALVELGARPLLAWALEGVEGNDRVDRAVVVAHPASVGAVAALVAAGGFAKVSAVVAGGSTRRASVAAGLDALEPGPGYVAVHDACRPLLRPGAIDRLAALLDDLGVHGVPGRSREHLGVHGVAPGAAVTDTVRRVAAANRSGGIVRREELRTLQTPQVFVRPALEEAHRRAAAGALADPGQADAASDAVLLELAGFPVAVVAGETENLTIATALDLEVAEVLAARAAREQAAG